MQLMPGTAADLGVKDSFQPEQNVRGGSAYLDALLIRGITTTWPWRWPRITLGRRPSTNTTAFRPTAKRAPT